jgi:DNA repair exonuclease SbcCD ATPase subunit
MALLQPKDTYRFVVGHSDEPTPGLGSNPKSGVTFDYYLPQALDSLELTLEVVSNGKVIRSYTNQKPKDFKSWPGGPQKPELLPAKKGFNRFTWDFRREGLPAIENVFVFGGLYGSLVGPGTYALRLRQGDRTVETVVNILPNPNIKASLPEYEEQQQILEEIEAAVTDIHKAVNSMRSAKKQLQHYKELLEGNEKAADLVKKGDALMERIATWEENLIQPKQKTFQDVINFTNKLNAQLLELRGYVDVAEPKVTQGAKERLKDLLQEWGTFKAEHNAIVHTEMKDYNTTYEALALPALLIKD